MTLIEKLTTVMAAIDHVDKRGRNQAQGYDYVKATDLAATVRKELAKAKVFMTSDVAEVRHSQFQTMKGSLMNVVDMKVLYTFHDGESDAKLSFHGYGSGMDSGDKAVYKAHTGALKYALRNGFLIPDEKAEPEADESVDREAETAPDCTICGNEITAQRVNKLMRTWQQAVAVSRRDFNADLCWECIAKEIKAKRETKVAEKVS
jgi:ribosomal protein L34E